MSWHLKHWSSDNKEFSEQVRQIFVVRSSLPPRNFFPISIPYSTPPDIMQTRPSWALALRSHLCDGNMHWLSDHKTGTHECSSPKAGTFLSRLNDRNVLFRTCAIDQHGLLQYYVPKQTLQNHQILFVQGVHICQFSELIFFQSQGWKLMLFLPPWGWSMECLQEWGSFMKLAIPSAFMFCLEWWVYEFGGIFAGKPATQHLKNCIYNTLISCLFV